MVHMENGKMELDSKTEVVELDSHVIMELGNKSIRTRCNDDNESSVTFQNNDNAIREKMFSNCNGNSNTSDELSSLTNGVEMCNICDDKSYNNSKGSNSSQCSISSAQKTIGSSLENNLSNLSIKTDHEENPSKVIESSCKNCDNSSPYNEYSTESDQKSQPVNPNESKTDHGLIDASFLPDDSQSSRNSEKEKEDDDVSEVVYICYESEKQMPDIMKLIQKDLSEPYSIYTYRYFIHNWPHLCFLAICKGTSVGAIVCKLDIHRKVIKRGYIAMLAVDESYRKHGIGSNLVLKAIRVMAAEGADEVVLETEITNQPALRLYENLGFVRDKRLFRYYLNGVDALRLKLWLR